MPVANKVNADLQRERDKCTFNVLELTQFLDGGAANTAKRIALEDEVLREADLIAEVPEDYLSHKEKYELAIKTACVLSNIFRRRMKDKEPSVDFLWELLNTSVGGTLNSHVLRDSSPLALHLSMFLPTLINQGSPEQQHWARRAWNYEIIGTYAQTELGHGTFIRGLETTATYVPRLRSFVLNSPTLSAYKWWPGSLGHTANYGIVLAQLYTKGRCYGVHPFIVQLRDEDTHVPLPGIHVGEIGPKMGFNTVNNGFLGFKNVQIPRENMLMKNAEVLPDGTYKKLADPKLTYGTMVFVRVRIVRDMVYYIKNAATIAVRYSALRKQSELHPGKGEVQVLDFVTQQHKLLIAIATAHAFHNTVLDLSRIYRVATTHIAQGDTSRLPELHALSCCLKAISTSDASSIIERCRMACGGHGFMHSSNLPFQYVLATAAATYEGENTVLLLQGARYLVKVWKNVLKGEQLAQSVAYLNEVHNNKQFPTWKNNIQHIIKSFQYVAMKKVRSSVASLERRVDSGMLYEDAWNMTSVQLVSAAEAHGRAFSLSSFYEETLSSTRTVSHQLRTVLLQLLDLYAAYWALERAADLLKYAVITEKDIDSLMTWYEELLGEIRPNAVGLVDGFGVRDELLHSTIGAYDGRAYERLMEEALKSPLNKEPVNESYHKYLKPFMRAKI